MGTLFEVNGTNGNKAIGNVTSVRNFCSSQWGKTLGSTSVNDGTTYNLSVAFDPTTDEDSDGTSTYDQMNLAYGIDLDLSGSSGTANINVDGVNYLATFDTDLTTTASNWCTANTSTLRALGINVSDYGSGKIRFCASQTICDGITITNVSGDLNGTLANGFTGLSTSAPDHFLQPYDTKPYVNQRLQYNIRVNLNINNGSDQTLSLSLRRFQNDSLIGSSIPLRRNQDETGKQVVFVTYTASASDPFVTGGFYFLLTNNSGQNVILSGKIGFLIQTYYELPTHFSGL
jgi:hypothetical protein